MGKLLNNKLVNFLRVLNGIWIIITKKKKCIEILIKIQEASLILRFSIVNQMVVSIIV